VPGDVTQTPLSTATVTPQQTQAGPTAYLHFLYEFLLSPQKDEKPGLYKIQPPNYNNLRCNRAETSLKKKKKKNRAEQSRDES
jgi:hypothetical protein